ncbi:hypothetical protein LIA77_09070 [Sarocladium implicatum]|nr:hypothetical protein LIA77_09070 [Sarocladium implicatum]
MGTTNFTAEIWTYLAIDLAVVFGRFGLRWHETGLSRLCPDDYLMIIAGLLYTAETATAHYVGAYWFGLANSGMTPEQRQALDPTSLEYHLRVEGSKTQLFGWLVYTVLLWTLKTSWLFFYKRLGSGVDDMKLKINIGFVFVGITFLGTFFTILCGCWPIAKHWQINPDPGNFCQPAVSKLQAWTLICTNITTDFYIMTIPVPMIWQARISKTKKAGLGVMLCGGLLTAVFGGLRCGYVLQDSPDGPQLAGEWSCRESFVAVLISNIPVLFPILRQHYKHIRNTTTSFSRSYTEPDPSKSSSVFRMRTISSKNDGKKRFKHPLSLPGDTFYERYSSEEEIVSKAGATTKNTQQQTAGAESVATAS